MFVNPTPQCHFVRFISHVVWFSKKLEHLDHACDIHIQKVYSRIFLDKETNEEKYWIPYYSGLYIQTTHRVFCLCCFFLVRSLVISKSTKTDSHVLPLLSLLWMMIILCVCACFRENSHVTSLWFIWQAFWFIKISSKHGVFSHVFKTCQSEWIFNHHIEIDLDFNSHLQSLY